jgi:hypothetical protein
VSAEYVARTKLSGADVYLAHRAVKQGATPLYTFDRNLRHSSLTPNCSETAAARGREAGRGSKRERLGGGGGGNGS